MSMLALGGEQGGLAGAFGLVLLADGGGVLLSSPAISLNASSGTPVSQEGGGGAEQGVADPDAGVEEAEGLAGFEGLEPEGDLGEFGGEVVEVDAVDAAADDVVQGVGDLFGGGFVLPGAGLGDRRAIRRAAATRNPPEPEAGSQTVTASRRASASAGSLAFFTASSRTGSRAVSSRAETRAGGV